MQVKNYVICDRETRYAERLMQMFINRNEPEYQFFLFFTMEELKNFACQNQIHVLVMDGAFPEEERQMIPASQKFVFSKKGEETFAEGEKGLYRYQSAEQIWALTAGTRQEVEKPQPMANKAAIEDGELIGVYSPIHRIGKTSFALRLGRELAEKTPTLYINMEAYAGGDCYFPEEPKNNLADLIYEIRQERGDLGLRISMAAGQDKKLDYIFPMASARDLKEVSKEEWLQLLECIQRQCIYEKIILDLGEEVSGLLDILNRCDTIYTLYLEDEISQAKLSQYTETIRQMGLEDILEKTVMRNCQEERR